MNTSRLVFAVLPRLIALLLLWDLISALASKGLGLFTEFTAALQAGLDAAIPLMLSYASLVSAALAVAFASPVVYALTLVLLVIAGYREHALISPISIAGLFVLLALDSLGLTYRSGQHKSVKYESLLGVFKGVATCFLVIALFLSVATLASSTATLLLSSIEGFRGSSLLALLLANPVFRLVLVVGVAAVTYTALSYLVEAFSTYAVPSKVSALKYLLDTRELDVVFNAPLGFVKSIVVVSFVAPLVYTLIMDLAVPFLIHALGRVFPLATYAEQLGFKFATALLSIALAWLLVSKLTSFYYEIGELRGVLVLLVLLLGFLYSVGVYYRYAETGNLALSILLPDFSYVEARAASIYYNFYVNFIYFLELISIAGGFAP